MNNAFWAGEAIANGMELDSLKNTVSSYRNEIYSCNQKINDLNAKINEQQKNENIAKKKIYSLAQIINSDPRNVTWQYTKMRLDTANLYGDIAFKCYLHERRNRDIFEKVINILKEKFNIPESLIEELITKTYADVKDQPFEHIRMTLVGSPRFKDDLRHKEIMSLLDKIKVMFDERDKLSQEMNSIAAMLAPAPAPAPASPAPAAEASAPAAPADTAAAEQAPAQEAKAEEGKAEEGAAPAPEASTLATELEDEKAERGLISRMFGGSGKKSK